MKTWQTNIIIHVEEQSLTKGRKYWADSCIKLHIHLSPKVVSISLPICFNRPLPTRFLSNSPSLAPVILIFFLIVLWFCNQSNSTSLFMLITAMTFTQHFYVLNNSSNYLLLWYKLCSSKCYISNCYRPLVKDNFKYNRWQLKNNLSLSLLRVLKNITSLLCYL